VKLTTHDVAYVAALARIAIDEGDMERLTEQLSSILTHIDTLREVDTSHISPTEYAVTDSNVIRVDEPRPSLPVDNLLANAPDRQGDLLRVDAVFEQ